MKLIEERVQIVDTQDSVGNSDISTILKNKVNEA